jgi:hypothetical protein
MRSFLLLVVGKESMPAAVTVERSQSQECLIAIQAPELTGALEAALILRTG